MYATNPRDTALLSVVIPSRDSCGLTLACLGALAATREPDLEVLVVDDASTDDSAAAVTARFPAVRLLRREQPGGFSAAANQGLAAARGALLLLLNSDTEVDPGGLAALRAAFAARPRLGIAGARLRFPDQRPQWSGGSEPTPLWLFALASGAPAVLGRWRPYRRLAPVAGSSGAAVRWVTGAAMALRREVWERHGPLEASFAFYGQDLDLCLRAGEAGWEVAVLAEFGVVHHQGGTVGRQAGAAGSQNPSLLWRDLLRWAELRRPAAAARRMRWALLAGATLRLAGRAALSPWVGTAARPAWRRESAAYRQAWRALRTGQ